jgi:hypothetical protein
MLRPTIYIPSRLTKLLPPLQPELLPSLAELVRLVDGCLAGSVDLGGVGLSGREDWRASNDRWKGSRSLCTA